MNPKSEGVNPSISLRELYPELCDRQLEEVEETLEQYIEVVLRIFNRLQLEKKAAESQTLTPMEKESTMIANTPEVQ